MLSLTTLIAAVAAIGIQFGSAPLKGGGNTYIIQVEPELIDSLSSDGLTSDVPPGLRDIRRIEIRVGGGTLPNQGVTSFKVPADSGDAAKPPRLDDAPSKPGSPSFTIGAESLPGGGNSFIVQIEPELISSFRTDGFSSEVPTGLHDIRRIEVRVGATPQPNQESTVFKVPTMVNAAKPPIGDAAEPDPGAKHTTAAGNLRNEPAVQAPKKLPSEFAANGLTAAKDRAVEPASYQSRERAPQGADGGPSAAANLTDSLGPSGKTQPRSQRDTDSDWASIPLLAALGALIVSAAANFYLLWVHLGTRRRYYEVVQQLHESDLPIAVPPLDHS